MYARMDIQTTMPIKNKIKIINNYLHYQKRPLKIPVYLFIRFNEQDHKHRDEVYQTLPKSYTVLKPILTDCPTGVFRRPHHGDG